ncbi:MAG: NADH-quinone oxidoreductase subunit NuoF [Firmicutes bacterium]|nr:NADH-quinone oxidoreductase subunit NuoF [Bacillota bacterium]
MTQLLVCGDSGCRSSGGDAVLAALQEAVRRAGAEGQIQLVRTGCHGFCEAGPVVLVEPVHAFYCRVNESDAADMVAAARRGEVLERLLYRPDPQAPPVVHPEDIPFYQKQVKRVLARCGRIDPEEIGDYLAAGGYQALAKALHQMTPEQVIEEVKRSGLRGRGGGGFPTGLKWQLTRQAQGSPKYVICNADEGDPGAFMDRSVLEGDPHSVVEGLILCAYAVGASEGFIYVRAEYPMAVKTLRRAIAQARERGFLGRNILGSGMDFELHIKEGAGAFVCGEETALMASIEGRRGMPRPRPPFPAQSGLWGKPTNINNVETYANVPMIITRGADWYAALGTERSKGTKVFALTGRINHTGLVEVPMGITLREIIYDVGGGIRGGRKFKAVQIGGPSGGCLSAQHLDLPIDYDSLTAAGAMMGSGGLVTLDETTCMVDLARFFMNFMRNESCGKCTPCREGTQRMLETLERICGGQGTLDDLSYLEKTGQVMKRASLCGLGQTAPNPVLSTLRYFRAEYEAHILEHRCPAGVCKALLAYYIEADLCRGCGKCARQCPAGAITGEPKHPYQIDPEKCVRCGGCVDACAFDAVRTA